MNPQHLPEIIKNQRITLKKHSLDLAALMFSFVDQDRLRLQNFLPWVNQTKSVQDEIEYIQVTHRNWEAFASYDFGIYRNHDDQYLGNIGIHTISWANNRCEIGYWILGIYQGQGFVSEAVILLENTCFEMGFHRLEIHCSSKNVKSMNVPKRCGYELEGTFKQDSIENGEYRDTHVFGKIQNSKKRSFNLK